MSRLVCVVVPLLALSASMVVQGLRLNRMTNPTLGSEVNCDAEYEYFTMTIGNESRKFGFLEPDSGRWAYVSDGPLFARFDKYAGPHRSRDERMDLYYVDSEGPWGGSWRFYYRKSADWVLVATSGNTTARNVACADGWRTSLDNSPVNLTIVESHDPYADLDDDVDDDDDGSDHDGPGDAPDEDDDDIQDHAPDEDDDDDEGVDNTDDDDADDYSYDDDDDDDDEDGAQGEDNDGDDDDCYNMPQAVKVAIGSESRLFKVAWRNDTWLYTSMQLFTRFDKYAGRHYGHDLIELSRSDSREYARGAWELWYGSLQAKDVVWVLAATSSNTTYHNPSCATGWWSSLDNSSLSPVITDMVDNDGEDGCRYDRYDPDLLNVTVGHESHAFHRQKQFLGMYVSPNSFARFDHYAGSHHGHNRLVLWHSPHDTWQLWYAPTRVRDVDWVLVASSSYTTIGNASWPVEGNAVCAGGWRTSLDDSPLTVSITVITPP